MQSKLLVLLSILILAAAFSPVRAQQGTLADVASEAGTFNTLLAAVAAAEPTAAAALTGDAPLTLFAPTDEAFAALPPGVVDYLLANPDLLTQVLLYHIVDGALMAADVMGTTEPTEVTTLQGGPITILASDAGVSVDGVEVTATDIEASNGVIHVIDAVLIPPVTLPEVDPLTITGDIIIAGSSTVAPLTQVAIESFISVGYNGAITNDSIGTGAGFERFCEGGDTDISSASRPIRDSEIDACADLRIPRTPLEFRVGTDALTVVVSAENDFVDSLSIEQLAQIFSGEVTTWDEVDASFPPEFIQVFSPGSDSGTFDYFLEETLEAEPEDGGLGLDTAAAEAAVASVPGIQFSEDDNVLVQGVETSPYTIGYFGYAYYLQNQDRLKAVAINGIAADAASVDAGEYPLARPLFIYSDAGILASRPQVAAFINFYLSSDREFVSQVGYFQSSERAIRLARLTLLANVSMTGA